MAPESESMEAKVARLDERQKAQERDILSVRKVAEDAVESAMEAKDAIVQVNQTMAAMPQTIIAAIDKRGGNRWSIANQWLVVAVAIAAPFVAKWLGI